MKKIRNCTIGILTAVFLSVSFVSCAPSYVVARPSQPVYVRPGAPGPGYIWVNDNWVWRGGRYEYQHGYWTLPRRNQVWVEGNWQSRGGKYYWTPGRWRTARGRY